MKESKMDKDTALKLFEYRDGLLFWKNPSNPNKTPIGSLAGTISKRGYVHIQYMRKIYKAHRLIYLMFHGETFDVIDHVNGNTSDNRIENLRVASTSENQRNAKIRKDNSSGVKNVSWHKRIGKWGVQLNIDKKIKHFGYYEDLELAELIAMEARNKFHNNFACHGAR